MNAELQQLDVLIANLPDGYVRDILTDSRAAIENAIRNDITCGVIADQISESARLSAEIAEKRKELANMVTEKAKRLKELERVEEAIRAIKWEAKRIAG